MKTNCHRCQTSQKVGRLCENCGAQLDYHPIHSRKEKILIVSLLAILGLLMVPVLLQEKALNSFNFLTNTSNKANEADELLIGSKPSQFFWNDEVPPVKRYLKETLSESDYDNSEFMEWSPVTKVVVNKEPYWQVKLKLRIKKGSDFYTTSEKYYFIRNNQVIFSKGLDGN